MQPEAMAKPYLKLLSDLEYFQRRNKEQNATAERMARRIAALQGVITKMKKSKSK
jgi:hypothetical protein